MQRERNSEVSIKDIAELMSYFLAGSFLIGSVFSTKPNNGAIEPKDWLNLGVGIIIIASGLIFALVSLPFKHIEKFREGLE